MGETSIPSHTTLVTDDRGPVPPVVTKGDTRVSRVRTRDVRLGCTNRTRDVSTCGYTHRAGVGIDGVPKSTGVEGGDVLSAPRVRVVPRPSAVTDVVLIPPQDLGSRPRSPGTSVVPVGRVGWGDSPGVNYPSRPGPHFFQDPHLLMSALGLRYLTGTVRSPPSLPISLLLSLFLPFYLSVCLCVSVSPSLCVSLSSSPIVLSLLLSPTLHLSLYLFLFFRLLSLQPLSGCFPFSVFVRSVSLSVHHVCLCPSLSK